MIELMTKDKFSIIIETLVIEDRLSYVDAIVYWCESNEMDVETAAKLISPTLRERMERECVELNIFKGGAQLPI
jgi:hypothetical protein